jgi:hypothetical protein
MTETPLNEHRPERCTRFSDLPRKIRVQATDIALFYLMIGYISEYEMCDQEFLALQVQYRLLKTWQAIERHVKQERILRGGEYTFLNTLEVFVERVRALDSDAIAHRMFNRINGSLPSRDRHLMERRSGP